MFNKESKFSGLLVPYYWQIMFLLWIRKQTEFVYYAKNALKRHDTDMQITHSLWLYGAHIQGTCKDIPECAYID